MQFLTNFYYKQKDDLEHSLKEAGFEYWEIREEAFDKLGDIIPEDFALYIPKEEHYPENPKLETFYDIASQIRVQTVLHFREVGIDILFENTEYVYSTMSREEAVELNKIDKDEG